MRLFLTAFIGLFLASGCAPPEAREPAAAKHVAMSLAKEAHPGSLSPPSWSGGVSLAVFSPDGRFLATYTNSGSGDAQNVLILWDTSKAQTDRGERKGLRWKVTPFEQDKKRDPWLYSLSFSPDGKHVLAVGGYHGEAELRKFAVADGKLVKLHPLHKTTHAAFTAWGAGLVVVQARKVRLLDTAEGQRKGEEVHLGPYLARAHPSPDGSRFLTWSERDGLLEYEFRTGKLIRRLGDAAKGVQFKAEYAEGPDGILIRGVKPALRLVATTSGKDVELPRHLRDVTYKDDLVFSPDGKKVVRVAADGAATVLDLKTGKLLHRLPRYHVLEQSEEGVLHRGGGIVRFSPDSTSLLVAGFSYGTYDFFDRHRLSGDRTAVLLFDLTTGKTRTLAFPLSGE